MISSSFVSCKRQPERGSAGELTSTAQLKVSARAIRFGVLYRSSFFLLDHVSCDSQKRREVTDIWETK